METAGVVTENKNVPTFRKHLTDAGLSFTERPGPMRDTTLLKVTCESAIGIKPIIEAAYRACP